MRKHISDALRLLVARRAEFTCEYCLTHEDDTYFGGEVDHIISIKHGGTSDPDNLAYACYFCNRGKGSDIGSITLDSRILTRFFNPRSDRWSEHFRIKGVTIEGLTDIGRVTSRILGFNELDRIEERQALLDLGRYPSPSALGRLASEQRVE